MFSSRCGRRQLVREKWRRRFDGSPVRKIVGNAAAKKVETTADLFQNLVTKDGRDCVHTLARTTWIAVGGRQCGPNVCKKRKLVQDQKVLDTF